VLYDKIHRRDVLQEALRVAKQNKGAAGVDGQTFEQIEEYGEERWLQELQRDLQTRTYRPQPVRRVLIPKPGGGERPLGIPTIGDRVVQTAAKLILEPIFEADLSDAAYGYRPERGAWQAVQQVHRELARGRTEVVDADLSKCFDTIPHAELVTCLARRIADQAVLHLIKMWLKVPVQEKHEKGAEVHRWQALQARHAAGRCDFAAAGEHQHQPVAQGFCAERLDEKVRSADRQLRRRLRGRVPAGAGHGCAGAGEAMDRGMRLTLNEAKTCVRDARKEFFRFLGYEPGPLMDRRTRRRYLGARPSKKAMERVRERVSLIPYRGRVEPWKQICRELNQYLAGWANYFAYGSPAVSFRLVDIHVADRARNLLRRRHKLPSGTGRFGYQELHRQYGILEVRSIVRLHARA
jgi:RNA-directed DNA polymerase